MNHKLFAVAFVLLTICGVSSLAGAFYIIQSERNMTPSEVITETKEIKDIKNIEVSIVGQLNVKIGETESVVIEGEERYINDTRVETNGDTLKVIQTPPRPRIFSFGEYRKVTVTVTVKELSKLDIEGVLNVNAEDIKGESLTVMSNGVGNINIKNIDVKSLSVELQGASDITVSGNAESQKVVIKGVGEYDAEKLNTLNTDVSLEGSGEANVTATNSLKAKLNGVGQITYGGNPIDTDFERNGLGSIDKR
jgi:hypothetical protein